MKTQQCSPRPVLDPRSLLMKCGSRNKQVKSLPPDWQKSASLSALPSCFPAAVGADSYHPPNAVFPSQTAAPTPSETGKMKEVLNTRHTVIAKYRSTTQKQF